MFLIRFALYAITGCIVFRLFDSTPPEWVNQLQGMHRDYVFTLQTYKGLLFGSLTFFIPACIDTLFSAFHDQKV